MIDVCTEFVCQFWPFYLLLDQNKPTESSYLENVGLQMQMSFQSILSTSNVRHSTMSALTSKATFSILLSYQELQMGKFKCLLHSLMWILGICLPLVLGPA